jgi:hypothetical protein
MMKIECKCPPSSYIVFPAFLTTHSTLQGKTMLGSPHVRFSIFLSLDGWCVWYNWMQLV